mgnify:FL=1|jgi:arginase family enzyme
MRALEVAEYNPDWDRHGMTAKLICNLIADIVPRPGCAGRVNSRT